MKEKILVLLICSVFLLNPVQVRAAEKNPFGTCALILGVLAVAALAHRSWMLEQPALERREHTKDLVDGVTRAIRHFADREGELPQSFAAISLEDFERAETPKMRVEVREGGLLLYDAWGNTLQYERDLVSGLRFSIRSRGRDGLADTDDDISHTYSVRYEGGAALFRLIAESK